MTEFLFYTISGLTTAGIYAISASGLTLTYTTTGAFSFAHGAVGAAAAFTYWQLHIAWGVPTLLSFAIVLLLLAPTFGIGLEAVIMRRLDGTSDLTKLVVSVSILLALLAFVKWTWDPTEVRSLDPLWSGRVWVWGVVRVSYNDLTVLALAGLVAVGLRLLLHNTRPGVAMRATVDDRRLVVLNGSRPTTNARLAWAVSTSLAALAGILVAPKLTLSALPITLLIVNAYAAAVIARLRSLPMTFVGAVILGLLTDYSIGYLSQISVGQQYIRGFVNVIPVAVLFVVLVALPAQRLRGARQVREREWSERPTWGGSIALAGSVVAATVVVSTLLSSSELFNMTKLWGLALVGLSMVPLVGYAGRISLCQLSLAGIGAMVVGHVGHDGNPIAIVWAMAAAALVGSLIALPTLRLSPIYLALSTTAFAVALDRWLFNLPAFTVFGHEFQFFPSGTLLIPRSRWGPLDLDSDRAFFIAGAVVFALSLLAVVAIRRSELGCRIVAMRQSPAAYATIGLDARWTTVAVIALSSALAGLGGAIYGMGIQSATPSRFDFFLGVVLLLMMVIAGVGTVGSAVVAGVLVGGPALENLFGGYTPLFEMTVGFVGIGLGGNPNGLIVQRIRPRWETVRHTPGVVAAIVAALAVVWVVRLSGLIDNWTWTICTGALIVLVPTASGRVQARRVGEVGPVERSPEWTGLVARPTAADIAALDHALGLPRAIDGVA